MLHSYYLSGYNFDIINFSTDNLNTPEKIAAYYIGRRHGNQKLPILTKQQLSDYMEEQAERQKAFVCHGGYTISNCGGYEVEMSSDGESARLRDCYGSDFPVVTDWLEVEVVENKEWSEGDYEEERFHGVIDPAGFNIPLSLVMCA